MNSRKILIISPSLKLGGIERALTNLANEFVSQGFAVTYISCLKADHFYKLPDEVKLVEPRFRRLGGIFDKMLFYPKLLWFIRKSVTQIDPKVVLVFGDWFSPLTLLALLGLRTPVYISDRTIPDYPFKFPIPQLKNWLYPRSAGFIAQTARAKEYKEKIFGSKLNIRVIPNALPELSNKGRSDTSDCSILYVGRFAWEKDPEILIRAVPLVLEKFPDWRLMMAGDGPLFDKMRLLAEHLGVRGSIVFLGKVKDVASLYSSASLFVLPSKVEGFPNVLIEAMSFGLPCICFSDIPFEDIVSHEINGVIVDRRDASSLAEKMIDLIKDPYKRSNLGINAKDSVKRFEKEKIASMVLDFIAR